MGPAAATNGSYGQLKRFPSRPNAVVQSIWERPTTVRITRGTRRPEEATYVRDTDHITIGTTGEQATDRMSYRTQARRRGAVIQRNGTYGTAVLLVGFCAVLAAIAVARLAPADGYELSLYAGTPLVFWLLVSVAFVCALAVSFLPASPKHWFGGLVVGGEAFVAAVGIPLLRDYAFLGSGDPLTHLGWTRTIVAGDLSLTSLIYPGTHTIAIFFAQLLDVRLERAMLLASGVFVVVFVVFLTLAVYAITGDRDVTTVGAFSAMMLLPINNVGAHLTVFPSTLAVFFVPLVLVLLVVYLTETGSERRVTPVGALLALATGTLVLVHPQQATNLLIVFATVIGVILLKRRYGSGVAVRTPVGQCLFLGGFLVLWGGGHERITDAVSTYSGRVAGVVFGSPGGSNEIAQQTGSLTAIGASIPEILLKLFAVSFVYLAVTGLVLALIVLRRSDAADRRLGTVSLFGLATLPLGVLMLLYILGGVGTIYFRHLAFIMVIATVLGSIGIGRLLPRLRERSGSRLGLAILAVVVAGMLGFSLATAYASPMIYKPSGHVTEAQMDGYGTAFAHEDRTIGYVGIRTGPDRFRDGVRGVLDPDPWSPRTERSVPFGALDSDLAERYDEPRYLVVTDADVEREVIAFREYRYSERGFRTLGTQPGVDRVLTNGDFELYYVDG